jgi:8-oxo-dGTP diphosphatase
VPVFLFLNERRNRLEDPVQTLLVAAAIIEHGGKVLLARRRADVPYPLLWEFPGGKVEPGEDPADCVVREVREELVIEIAVERIYEVVFFRYPERNVLMLAYLCRWLSGDVTDREVAEHRWAAPEEVAAFDLLPADISLARRIGEEFGSGNSARL